MIGVDRYIIEKTDTVSVYAVEKLKRMIKAGVRKWQTFDIENSIPIDDESESSRGECPEHGVIESQFSVDRRSSGFKKYGRIGSMAFAVYE